MSPDSSSSQAPPDLTKSLDLHIGLKTTDTGAEFCTCALPDSGAMGSFIDYEFMVKNQTDTMTLTPHPHAEH